MMKKGILRLMLALAFIICAHPVAAPLSIGAYNESLWEGLSVAQAMSSGSANNTASKAAAASSNPIKKITVSPTKATAMTGDTISFKVSISPYNPSDLAVAYTNATLNLQSTVPDGSGSVTYSFKVTGKPSKKANVTFKSSKSKKVKKTVNITIKTVPVSSVTLKTKEETLIAGDTLTLSAAIVPTNAADKTVTWSTSNKSVATVSKSGVVTAKKQGVATISVKTKSGGKKASVKISVTSKPVTSKTAPESSYQREFEDEVLRLINGEREKRGLKKLKSDDSLKKGARVRAYEQETLYSHTRPNGKSWHTVLTVRPNIHYGEILYQIITGPQGAVKGWMNSSAHKAAIIKKEFTSAGVGVYQDSRGNLYWCVLFASY